MELEAAVIGKRLLNLIQKEMTLIFKQTFLWSNSHIVLGWIASNKKQNRLQKVYKISSPKEWHHNSTYLNPADHENQDLATN